MRKVFVAGAAAVSLAAAAFALAPAALSQTPTPEQRRDHRVMMLETRGSAIGVSVRDVTQDDVAKAKLDRPAGVVIEAVDEDGPAAKAGLRAGDVVVEFDGERVRSVRHFARLVQETPDGRTVKTTLVRQGSRQVLDVTPSSESGRWAGGLMQLPDLAGIEREVERGMRSLPRDFAFDLKWDGELPMARVWPRGRIGAELSPLTDQLAEYFGARQGVLVSSVSSDSVAATAGLKAGDVITSINGQTVETPRDVAEELREVSPGSEVEIGVVRAKKPLTLKAQMPERPRPATTTPRKVRPV